MYSEKPEEATFRGSSKHQNVEGSCIGEVHYALSNVCVLGNDFVALYLMSPYYCFSAQKAQTTNANATVQEFPTYFLSSTKATEGEEQFLGMVLALLPVRSRHFVVHVGDGNMATHCMRVPSYSYQRKSRR